MTIEEIKVAYADQWVLAEVLEEDDLGNPTNAKVLAHSPDRDVTYAALQAAESRGHLYHFYTGEIPKKGYAVAVACPAR